MIRVRVKNTGRRTRHRLGVEFPPGEEKTVEVSTREYITIKAVKDFKIMRTENLSSKPENGEENTFQDLTIEEAINYVEDEEISVEEAIQLEKEGKNRSTLIEKLEGMKEGDN